MKTEDLKYILETLEYGLKDCSDDNNDTTTHFNRFQNSIDVVEKELNKNDIIPDVASSTKVKCNKYTGQCMCYPYPKKQNKCQYYW